MEVGRNAFWSNVMGLFLHSEPVFLYTPRYIASSFSVSVVMFEKEEGKVIVCVIMILFGREIGSYYTRERSRLLYTCHEQFVIFDP